MSPVTTDSLRLLLLLLPGALHVSDAAQPEGPASLPKALPALERHVPHLELRAPPTCSCHGTLVQRPCDQPSFARAGRGYRRTAVTEMKGHLRGLGPQTHADPRRGDRPGSTETGSRRHFRAVVSPRRAPPAFRCAVAVSCSAISPRRGNAAEGRNMDFNISFATTDM